MSKTEDLFNHSSGYFRASFTINDISSANQMSIT